MKDNNLNNTKNVDNIDILYKPEGQINKQVYELLKNSKEGNYNNLKKLIEKEFQGSTLNLALRNIIKEFKSEKTNYIECLKLLLTTNIDLNYKYQKENNNTILMMVFNKYEPILMKEFLENLNIKKNSIYDNNNLSNKEKEEYEIKEMITFFTQKDSNNNNFFYVSGKDFDKIELFKLFEYIYDIYPYKNDSKKERSQKIQQIFKSLFTETNNDGNNFMNICLDHGLPKFVLKLISINGYIPNVNKQKNNYVHCAVLGKNMTCLKIVLYYCSIDDLNMKNCDTLTPAQLAYKLGFVTMSNLIIEYQNNYNEEGYKEHFYSSKEIYEKKVTNLSNHILINFKNYKYKEVLYELNELKIIYNLSKDDLNSNNNNIINKDKEEDLLFRISYIKLEWNIILTQFKIQINQLDIKNDTDSNNTNNNKNSNKNININSVNIFYKSFFDIFENMFCNKLILSYIDYVNKIKNKNNSNNNHEFSINYINVDRSIEILLYNKILFYFKYGHTKSLIETAKIYFTKIFKNNNDITIHKNSFILYVNISCILAETFISQGYHNFAEIIIKALEKYLYVNHEKNCDIEYTKEEKSFFDYLSKVEVFHQYSAYFSEMLCYTNFLKLLITKEKIKDLFTNGYKLLKDSQFAKEASIFNRLYILYSYMEIKKLYEKEDNRIYDRLSEVKKNGENSEIYYYNTIGIIYLKKQKYHLSKLFFTKAFSKYINIIKNKNIQNDNKEKIINFRIDFITSFLYNICLCHFYLKEYNKCIIILEQLLLFKSNQNNFFIHYRLGLCYFQLYINENKKNIDYYNENILKILGYEKFKNKSTKNEKSLSIDLEIGDSEQNDNEFYQFDSENKNSNNKGCFNNKFSCNNKKDNCKKNKNSETNNCTYYNNNNNNCSNSAIKRIILKNATKMININKSNFAKKNNINYIKNNNIINNELFTYNNGNNINTNYIDKAIKSFKKVILISKMNTCTDSMKSIYNFYSSYITDDNSQKSPDFSQNFYKKKKIPNDLLINNYLNLLLCLSAKKSWLEIIFIIKDYTNRKIVSNKVILMKILLYKLEAYINLKNTQKIKEIINKLKGYKKFDLSVYNKANNDIINEVKIKLYLYYTLTIIYIKEKNYKEMDININKIFFLIKDEKKVPYYIIDLLINVYLIKLNNESNLNEKLKYKYNNIILNLIKNKKTNIEE